MRYNVDSISLHGRVILNITLLVMKLHALANFKLLAAVFKVAFLIIQLHIGFARSSRCKFSRTRGTKWTKYKKITENMRKRDPHRSFEQMPRKTGLSNR